MRALLLAAFLGFWASPALARPCTTQNYSDPDKPPNWSCPGPDEGILLPDIAFQPSIGLESGSYVVLRGTQKRLVLTYPAILMDSDKALQLGLRIQALRKLRWLERHKMAETIAIEKRYISDRLTAQLTLEKDRTKVALQQRDTALQELKRATRWYRSWTCGLVAGIITTAATAFAIAYAAK